MHFGAESSTERVSRELSGEMASGSQFYLGQNLLACLSCFCLLAPTPQECLSEGETPAASSGPLLCL